MPDFPEEQDRFHAQLYEQIKTLFHIENMRGVQVLSNLGRIVQLCGMLDCQRFDRQELSMPRWRLMLNLFMAEKVGSSDGVTPSELSHFNRVSKNTISSLLRGLEEQGLIERKLDPKDLRTFRIHLTETGRQLILKTAPERIENLNQMLVSLPEEDMQQLTLLLNKLRLSLESQVHQSQAIQT